VHIPNWAVWALAGAAFALPLATGAPYLLQTLTNAWLAAMLDRCDQRQGRDDLHGRAERQSGAADRE
jgi:hypothetical protein